MKCPLTPSNEPHRLAALDQTGLLDTPLEERFERITRTACRLLNVPIAAISMVDMDRQWFKSIQGICATETSRAVSFCGHTILRSNELTIVPDARHDPRFADSPLVTDEPHIVFYAGFPLTAVDGNTIASLCVIDRQPRQFASADIQALSDLGAWAESEIRGQFLSSIQNDLVSQIGVEQRQALLDPLTRLWNRRGIDEFLRVSQGESALTPGNLGFIMLDIDHFKRVNDSHGHAIGDVVLREIGRRILSALRPHDAVGRIGGEEFLVVLTGLSSRKHLASVASQVIEGIGSLPIKTDSGPLNVTISAGAVLVPDNQADVDALIKLADEALYKAKLAGRNRAVIADCVIKSRIAE